MSDITQSKRIEKQTLDLSIENFLANGGVIQDCNHITQVKDVMQIDPNRNKGKRSFKAKNSRGQYV